MISADDISICAAQPISNRGGGALGRRGFSILELLIATLISLMIMAATVTLFGVVGDRISSGRAIIETNDRVRAAQNLLRTDILGRTGSMFPWEQPGAGNGYFEIVKGPYRDQYPNTDTMTGYTRNALLFTTRSKDRPFVGRFNGSSIESSTAEVAWFLQPMINTQGSLVTITNPNLAAVPRPCSCMRCLVGFYSSCLRRRHCR